MVGVAVGVLGSILLFLSQLVSAPVIHKRATGKERHSLQFRSKKERGLLEEHGESIICI